MVLASSCGRAEAIFYDLNSLLDAPTPWSVRQWNMGQKVLQRTPTPGPQD